MTMQSKNETVYILKPKMTHQIIKKVYFSIPSEHIK